VDVPTLTMSCKSRHKGEGGPHHTDAEARRGPRGSERFVANSLLRDRSAPFPYRGPFSQWTDLDGAGGGFDRTVEAVSGKSFWRRNRLWGVPSALLCGAGSCVAGVIPLELGGQVVPLLLMVERGIHEAPIAEHSPTLGHPPTIAGPSTSPSHAPPSCVLCPSFWAWHGPRTSTPASTTRPSS
jgi:hypothetical protein